ncbi:hypothetical protein VTK56DRAFT_9900 [Thermocarpiscus australiensis]
MSGTVLSTLCSICHAQPPKYKCPRCGARTCSVACVQKHKARADCDGLRNPRAFLSLSQLRTEAGIDHDFNFLTSIERARQRSEKDLVEIQRLLNEKELRPPNAEKLFHKVWYGDELRHVPVQSRPQARDTRPRDGPAFVGGFDKHVRRRLRLLGIETITMPKGMARQRENKTAWNRRTLSINWQVEWLVYGAAALGLPSHQQHNPFRILYKSLEGKPLNGALASTLEWHRGQLDRQNREDNGPNDSDMENENEPGEEPSPKAIRKSHRGRRKKKPQELSLPAQGQDPTTGIWSAAAYTAQYPLTGAWSQTATSPSIPKTLEEELATWQFFLLKATRSNPNTKTLIPLASTETLTSALTGRAVIEFPTIYTLPPGEGLPAGYTLGSTERREPKPQPQFRSDGRSGVGEGEDLRGRWSAHNNKYNEHSRKRTLDEGYRDRMAPAPHGRGGKRARFETRPRAVAVEEPDDEAEEGEINSDGDDVAGAVMAEGADREAMDADAGSGDSSGSNCDTDSDSTDSSVTEGGDGDGEAPEEEGSGPRGGLVDYASSDDSD